MWEHLIQLVTNHHLSDIHMRSGEVIRIREHGEIIHTQTRITEKEIMDFLRESIPPEDFANFLDHKDFDFAAQRNGLRFRVNAFWASDEIGLVMRYVESKIPNFQDLNLPAYLSNVPNIESGLVLVTGPTGSGKSTTLAAIIDVINQTRAGHIITIEDPIEFVHKSKQSLVNQREVGRDTKSFANALRASLREDPDVILVGELRDLETIQLALTAAETGHLVFGTLHTNSAPSTINRIIDVFPPNQQEQIRAQLATTLKLVVTQRLFRKLDNSGRVGAFEVMICNTAIRNLIRENKVFQIPNVMQTARQEGMLLMENSLKMLIAEGKISPASTLAM